MSVPPIPNHRSLGRRRDEVLLEGPRQLAVRGHGQKKRLANGRIGTLAVECRCHAYDHACTTAAVSLWPIVSAITEG